MPIFPRDGKLFRLSEIGPKSDYQTIELMLSLLKLAMFPDEVRDLFMQQQSIQPQLATTYSELERAMVEVLIFKHHVSRSRLKKAVRSCCKLLVQNLISSLEKIVGSLHLQYESAIGRISTLYERLIISHTFAICIRLAATPQIYPYNVEITTSNILIQNPTLAVRVDALANQLTLRQLEIWTRSFQSQMKDLRTE